MKIIKATQAILMLLAATGCSDEADKAVTPPPPPQSAAPAPYQVPMDKARGANAVVQDAAAQQKQYIDGAAD